MTPKHLIILVYEAKICPCCGAQLDFEPWTNDGRFQSDEICPCCGVQFGYTDFTRLEDLARRIEIYASIRDDWVKSGMNWRHADMRPANWDPISQLENLKSEA